MKLIWKNNPPVDEIINIEKIVKEDIEINLSSIDKPSELIFHTVFLSHTENYKEEPIVLVWGEEDDDENYHCEYIKDPEWKSLKSFDDDEEKC